MVKIAPLVGSAKTQELLYTRFVKMCTCKINFVRKECATAFPVMCEVLGNEVFEKNLVSLKSAGIDRIKLYLIFPFSFSFLYSCKYS